LVSFRAATAVDATEARTARENKPYMLVDDCGVYANASSMFPGLMFEIGTKV
jgi:hypothetical protein